MRKLGGLQCISEERDPQGPWLILFHGYGADASDLASLSDLLDLPRLNLLFPNAPLEVPIGPGWTGRAWWNIDMARIQRDAEQGIERDTSMEKPAELPRTRESALKMIRELGVPWGKIILGGFSQGGMLATDLAMTAPEQPLGLALLSTALINKDEYKTMAAKRAGLEFFQSHGELDPVLRLVNAQRLETLLTQAGLKGRLEKFRGGHEIPYPVIEKLKAYLKSRVEA